jgi:predicted DNA-binding transcriptional regulator AlpA
VAGELSSQDRLLTTPEAAKLLRLSRRTLEGMRVSGTGPRYFKLGPGKMAKVVYRTQDLERWLAAFQYGSTSEYEGS